jgi:hypothetical protein
MGNPVRPYKRNLGEIDKDVPVSLGGFEKLDTAAEIPVPIKGSGERKCLQPVILYGMSASVARSETTREIAVTMSTRAGLIEPELLARGARAELNEVNDDRRALGRFVLPRATSSS